MKASTKIATKAARVLRVLTSAWTVGAAALAMSQVSVTTYHNDNFRTGLNNAETILTPTSVTPSTFGLLFSLPVDGYVYAQPLYLPNVAIPNKGAHNVVYIATEHNSVYAFDADSSGPALWQVNLGPSVPNTDTGSWDIYPEIGITGTPVIVPAAQGVRGATPTMYLVSKTKTTDTNGNAVYTQKLHALDVTSGAEKFGAPVVIQGSVAGTGDGTDGHGHVPFQPLIQHNRSALLALTPSGVGIGGGSGTSTSASTADARPAGSTAPVIYIAFASHGDIGPYHGWLFSYNANTLQQTGIYNTTPNGKTAASGYPIAAGGIWQAGGGIASDGSSIFFATGNGSFDPSTGSYGDSVLRISLPNLTVADYFAPADQLTLDDYDIDLGSGAVMLLPGGTGTNLSPNLMVQAGKEGSIYLMNRTNLGKYGTVDHVIQELPSVMGGIWGSPAYFNGNIYFSPIYGSLLSFPISGNTMGGVSSWTPTYYQYPGATPSVSSNGNTNGIVWATQNDGTGPNGTAILHAYVATNLGTELYNSAATNGRDIMGGAVKFSVPTIANGKVYSGNAYSVSVFGLGKWAATPTVTPASGNYPNQVQVTVTDTTPNASIYYTTDGSTPTQSSTLYNGPVTFNSSLTFTARAFAPGYGGSVQVQNYYQVNAVIGNGTGLWGNYYNNYTDPSQPFPANPTASELDPLINFNWDGNSPISGVAGSNWGGEWKGTLQAETSSTYTIYTYSDDGVRVWVNGQQIINDWTYHAPTWDAGTITLTAGQKYNITIDYFQGGGGSVLQMYWTAPGMPWQLVPTSQLYPAPH